MSRELSEIGKRTLKQMRGEMPITDDRLINEKKLENVQRANHIKDVAYLPKINTNNRFEVRERIKEFFDMCVEDGVNPTVAEMALAIGISRKTMYDWLKGANPKDPEVLEEIRFGLNMINANMEHLMTDQKINPVSGIFLLKNNHGYQDTTNVVHVSSKYDNVDREALLDDLKLLDDKDEK